MIVNNFAVKQMFHCASRDR